MTPATAIHRVGLANSSLPPSIGMTTYFVYILSNRYRTVLYIGVTNDLTRRLREHGEGRGSQFAARYRVTDLIYYETFGEINDAIAREKQLKRWSRKKKLSLIRRSNPDLDTVELPRGDTL